MANLYAKAAGGNWSGAATWSAVSSVGVDSVGPPTAADDCYLDGGSGAVTIDTGAVGRSIDCLGYTNVLTHNAITFNIGDGTAGAGNIALRFVSGMTYTKVNAITSAIQFVSTAAGVQTIDYGGKNPGSTTFNAASGGSWKYLSGFTTASSITLTKGALDFNGQTLQALSFVSTGSLTRSLTCGAASLTLTGTGTVWSVTSSLALTPGTMIIKITDTSGTNKTFSSGGKNVYDILITPGGVGIIIFQGGSFSVNSIKMSAVGTKNVRFTQGQTVTFTGGTDCFPTGTAGNVITIDSASAGSAATLSKASGYVACDYISLKDSTATGGAVWYAGANSTSVSGNTGWIFTAPVTSTGFLAFML